MIYLFFAITALFSLLFLKHYYPYFKDADDLFSIGGFMLLFSVFTTFVAVLVFIPYFLFFE